MKEYHKIQSVFKRDEQTHKFIMGQYSLPEFEYLKDNLWDYTEKVDGTNIRVIWDAEKKEVTFKGKTDNASIPAPLIKVLQDLFPKDKFIELYPDNSLCLYGEGYGAKIQKGGGNYKPDGQDFALFDVRIGVWWLKREGVEDFSNKLGCRIVPLVGCGTIDQAINVVCVGLTSTWEKFPAEGLVLRPTVELYNRNGYRIITKLKTKDF